jgi:hypothetical protein
MRVSRMTFVVAAIVGVTVGVMIPLGLGALAREGTYVLSDFRIEYPYDDPRDEVLPSDKEAARCLCRVLA